MRTKLWNGWEVVDKIGTGRTGDVYRVLKKDNGMNIYCAVKYISLPRNMQELEQLISDGIIKDRSEASNYYKKILDDIKNEINVMKKFNGSSYIIDCYDYYQEAKVNGTGFDFYLRMELATDVISYFNNKKDVLLDVIQMGIDVCSALELCNKENIIHRDIKPNNIFVGNDGKFKLGDFGIATNVENNNKEIIGTYSYMAPEVYKKGNASIRTDIYSLGLVMYELLNNNKLPFVSKLVNEEKAFKIRMSGMGIPEIKKIDKELMGIILKACSFDSRDRYANPSSMKKDLTSVLERLNNGNVSRSGIVAVSTTSNRMKSNATDKTVSIYDAKRLESGGIVSSSISDNNEVVSDNKVGNFFGNIKERILGFYNDRLKGGIDKVRDKDFWLDNKWKMLALIIIILLIIFLKGCVFSDRKCEEGYITRLGMCVKGYYTCEEGYTLNSDNKCSKTLKSIDATATYTCEDGYILQDKYCIKNDTKEPVSEYQCAGLGNLEGDKCVQKQSTNAAATYTCPSGYIYYDEKCYSATNKTATASYSCPSGYSRSGTKCTKTTTTNPSTSAGSYKCNSGETLNGNKCYVNATCTSSTPDYCKWYPFYPGCSSSTQTCTCSSGYTLSGTQCYRSATYTSGSSYCTSGTLTNGKCVTTTTIDATVEYTCPSGYTIYGNQCIKTSSQKPTVKYYCAGGLTLEGDKCVSTITIDAVMGYSCDEGYVLMGTSCVLNDQKDATVEYSCSKVYTLNGSKCEKYELKNPTPHYEDKEGG